MQLRRDGKNRNNHELLRSFEDAAAITYRSFGLGAYGAAMRFVGMPLEKIALFMNSSQVLGDSQLRQAIKLSFSNESGRISLLEPYRVVGSASILAWFLQYSVMGAVFQFCDKTLSTILGVPTTPYGSQLMEDPKKKEIDTQSSLPTTLKKCSKLIIAPILAGTLESAVSNRAEVERYFGLKKFSKLESALKWNPIKRICGPAFIANSSRNCIMSGTSFVITPMLYMEYFPQEKKSVTSLFWFGLGVNIFVGNSIAITQQGLWCRSLDSLSAGKEAGKEIKYRAVIQQGLKKEGVAAFFTVPKWGSRVLMNAPAQGTLPWFYNEILPLGEGAALSIMRSVYFSVTKSMKNEEFYASQTSQNGLTYCNENQSQATR